MVLAHADAGMPKLFGIVTLLGMGLISWAQMALAQSTAVPTALPESNRVRSPVPPTHSTPDTANRVVPFTIRALTPAKQFEIRNERNDGTARCVQECRLALPLGTYTLRPLNEKGKSEPETNFKVTGPGRLEFDRPNTSLSSAGALIGTAGIAVVLVGTGLMMANLCVDTCEDQQARDTRASIGGAILLLGLPAIPIGWILFGRNRRPVKHEYPAESLGVTLTAGSNGTVFGFAGAF
jgi:hypothetical protein